MAQEESRPGVNEQGVAAPGNTNHYAVVVLPQRSRINPIESAAATASTRSKVEIPAAASFHPFARLPVELRQMIWHEAADNEPAAYIQTTYIQNESHLPRKVIQWRRAPVPAILQTCHESRSLVRIEAGATPKSKRTHYTFIPHQSSAGSHVAGVYINAEKDPLLFIFNKLELAMDAGVETEEEKLVSNLWPFASTVNHAHATAGAFAYVENGVLCFVRLLLKMEVALSRPLLDLVFFNNPTLPVPEWLNNLEVGEPGYQIIRSCQVASQSQSSRLQVRVRYLNETKLHKMPKSSHVVCMLWSSELCLFMSKSDNEEIALGTGPVEEHTAG